MSPGEDHLDSGRVIGENTGTEFEPAIREGVPERLRVGPHLFAAVQRRAAGDREPHVGMLVGQVSLHVSVVECRDVAVQDLLRLAGLCRWHGPPPYRSDA